MRLFLLSEEYSEKNELKTAAIVTNPMPRTSTNEIMCFENMLLNIFPPLLFQINTILTQFNTYFNNQIKQFVIISYINIKFIKYC